MDEQNPEPQTDPNEPQIEPQAHGPNAEAAKYRKERKAFREERDQLRSRVDQHDRADVERLVADRLVDASDFWQGTTVDELRADDGSIDVEKAEAELAKLILAKPHYARPARLDLHQGVRQSVDPPAPSFGEALLSTKRGD